MWLPNIVFFTKPGRGKSGVLKTSSTDKKSRRIIGEDKASQKKIGLDTFLSERQKVLSMWPTGKEVDLDEAIEYQRNLSESRNFGKGVEKLDREGRTVMP